MPVESTIIFKGKADHLSQTIKGSKGEVEGFGGSVGGILGKLGGAFGAFGDTVTKVFTSVIDIIKNPVQGALAAATAAIGVFTAKAVELVEKAHQAFRLAKELELPIGKVLEFSKAAKKAEVDVNDLVTIWQKFQQQMAKSQEGTKEAQKLLDTFNRLGVSAETLAKGDAQQAIKEMSLVMNHTAGSVQKTADTMEIFGKKAGEVKLLLDAMRQENKGGLMTPAAVNMLEDYHKWWIQIKNTLSNILTACVLPILAGIHAQIKPVEILANKFKELSDWISRGTPSQARQNQLEDKEAVYQQRKAARDAKQREAAEQQAEVDKKAGEAKAKAAKEELELKEKLSGEISELEEKNRLSKMTEAEKLKYYEDQLKLAEAQVKEAEKHSELTVQDLNARKTKLELEEKVHDLSKKVNDEQFKEWKEKAKKNAEKAGGGATFDHLNHAFVNMNDMKGINQSQLDKLIEIDKKLGIAIKTPRNIFTV